MEPNLGYKNPTISHNKVSKGVKFSKDKYSFIQLFITRSKFSLILKTIKITVFFFVK